MYRIYRKILNSHVCSINLWTYKSLKSKANNIFVMFQCVPFIHNFTIANTVIFNKSYFRLDVCRGTEKTKANQQRCPVGLLTKPEPNQILPAVHIFSTSLLTNRLPYTRYGLYLVPQISLSMRKHVPTYPSM